MVVTNLIVTAYCACVVCCGSHAKGVTASGVRAKEGVTIAAPRAWQFGTIVRIDGVSGTRVVQDRTARRFDGRVDVFFSRHEDAKRFGISRRRVEIMNLTKGGQFDKH